MYKVTILTVALAATFTIPQAVEAQRPTQRGLGLGGPERLLGMRERLELSEQQVNQLRELRDEHITTRSAQMSQFMRQRALLESGDITREQFREVMEAQRETSDGVRAAHRARIEAILTEDQLEQVGVMMNRAQRDRAFRRGFERGRSMGQRGFRGRMPPRFHERRPGRWDRF